MITRRAFFKYTGGSLLALYVMGRSGTSLAVAAPVTGGSLDPASLTKFAAPC